MYKNIQNFHFFNYIINLQKNTGWSIKDRTLKYFINPLCFKNIFLLDNIFDFIL